MLRHLCNVQNLRHARCSVTVLQVSAVPSAYAGLGGPFDGSSIVAVAGPQWVPALSQPGQVQPRGSHLVRAIDQTSCPEHFDNM